MAAGFVPAKILLASAELRLFDRLRAGDATAADVAVELGAPARGLEIVLDALVALGLVEKDAGRYRNAPAYEPFLVEDGPTHFVASLRHRNRLFRHWAFLEEVVLGGAKPAALDDRGSLEDPKHNDDFIRAMYAGSHARVASVVDRIDLDGVLQVADVGGGPGHYLAEILRRLPKAQGFLVDLPLTIQAAKRIRADGETRDRTTYVAWDFYADGPPPRLPPLDLVFLSQVVHAACADDNTALFRRLAPLLRPDGRLVVQEHVVDPDRTTPREAALFAVNMLAMTPAGTTYTEAEIRRFAEGAGLLPDGGERLDGRAHLLVYRRPTEAERVRTD